jgi:hypothetical protein
MPSKRTKEQYIEEAKKIHNNKFDYTLIKELPKRDIKVNIICPLHGNPVLYDKDEINPKIGISYGDLYNKTIIKSKVIIEKGYNIIEIWENDWKKFIKAIKILQNRWRVRHNLL